MHLQISSDELLLRCRQRQMWEINGMLLNSWSNRVKRGSAFVRINPQMEMKMMSAVQNELWNLINVAYVNHYGHTHTEHSEVFRATGSGHKAGKPAGWNPLSRLLPRSPSPFLPLSSSVALWQRGGGDSLRIGRKSHQCGRTSPQDRCHAAPSSAPAHLQPEAQFHSDLLTFPVISPLV